MKGYIYILTNPAFPQYVKIGYATNVDSRLKTLNSNSGLPLPFEVYATYETVDKLEDLVLHKLIDRLNPELRLVKNKEFYEVDAEEAYYWLEAIAEISGTKNRLSLKAEPHVKDSHKSPMAPFNFEMVDISVGEDVEFLDKPGFTATVVNKKRVEYEGQIYSLSALAQKLLKEECGKDWAAVQGPLHFTYKGKILADLREEKENNKN